MPKLANLRSRLIQGRNPRIEVTDKYSETIGDRSQPLLNTLEIKIDNPHITYQEFWIIILLTFMGLLSDSNLTLLTYLVKQANNHQVVLKTINEIAEATKLSTKTVVEGIKLFKKQGLLDRRRSIIMFSDLVKISNLDSLNLFLQSPVVIKFK